MRKRLIIMAMGLAKIISSRVKGAGLIARRPTRGSKKGWEGRVEEIEGKEEGGTLVLTTKTRCFIVRLLAKDLILFLGVTVTQLSSTTVGEDEKG